jgi:hypothetical protein
MGLFMKKIMNPVFPFFLFPSCLKSHGSGSRSGRYNTGVFRFRALLLFLLPGLLSISDFSQARCQFFGVENGFAHASQHLPANAKGVLFLVDGPPDGYLVRSGKLKGALVLSEMGPALSDKNFFFEERDPSSIMTQVFGGKKRKATVTRVPLEKFRVPLEKPQKYFAAKTPGLARCAYEYRFSLDPCEEIETNQDQLIAQGELYDATQELNKAHGLFRISPAKGFLPGKEYRVRYSGPLKEKEDVGVSYRRKTTVTIDKTPWNPLAQKVASLIIDNSVVKFKFPPALLPYQDYLYTYMLLSLDGGTRPYVSIQSVRNQEMWESGKAKRTTDSLCPPDHSTWKKWMRARREYSNYYASEPNVFSERACHKAKGLLGFFEVEDTFWESPEISVNCH